MANKFMILWRSLKVNRTSESEGKFWISSKSNPSFAPRFCDRGALGLVDVGSTSEVAGSRLGEIRDISVANGWIALLWDLVTLPVNEGRADPIAARNGFGARTGRDVGDSLIDSSKLSSSSLALMILARLLKFEEGNFRSRKSWAIVY